MSAIKRKRNAKKSKNVALMFTLIVHFGIIGGLAYKAGAFDGNSGKDKTEIKLNTDKYYKKKKKSKRSKRTAHINNMKMQTSLVRLTKTA